MSWSRASLLAALLALPVPFALADTVIVSTTVDENNIANSLCSLREAIAYLKTVDGLALDAVGRPANNANGCAREGDASDTHSIKLPFDKSAYLIEGTPIDIDISVSISGDESSDDVPLSPFIWVKADQGFKIDGPVVPPAIAAQVSSIHLLKSLNATDIDVDNQTSNAYPFFTGPVNGYPLVCLYRQVGTDAETFLRAVIPPAVGDWIERSPMPFALGVNKLIVTGTSDATCPALAVAVDEIGRLDINVYVPNIVSMSLIDIVGCGAAVANLPEHIADAGVAPAACSFTSGDGSQGGIFYLNESLTLEAMAIRGGGAEQGGIFYVGEDGVLTITASALLQATADEGAAIYMERSSLQLIDTLVADNGNNGSPADQAIKFASGELLGGISRSVIQNSTFHGNNGFALSLNENVLLNSLTILGGVGGAINFSGDLAGTGGNVQVFNSIISGICTGAPAAWVLANTPKFNLADATCGFTGTSNMLVPAVLVASVNADKTCGPTGRLCPKDTDDDGIFDFYVPRYLSDDISFSKDASNADIVIINKGSNESASSCPSQDQRNSDRSKAGRCDIGAVEFQFNGALLNSGGTLVTGSYAQSFAPDLGDEELFLPVGGCPVILPTAKTTDGCPWLSLAPTKGSISLTPDSKGYVYNSPNGFHGFDTFRIEVTTTASRLNDPSHPTGTTRTVSGKVTSEPESGIESSGLLGGGSMDWVGLLGLAGLLLQRRIRKGGVRV